MGKKILFGSTLFFFLGGIVFCAEFAAQNRFEVAYGKAVHAFFAGHYQETVKLLESTEKRKNEDPRAYYFLALAQLRLGEKDLADQIFKKAARLELEGRSARDFDIPETLRRIQGKERLLVEKYRREARLKWQNEEKKRKAVLFGEQKAKDRATLAELAKPVVATAPFGARSVDPFAKVDSVEKAVAPAAKAPVRTAPVTESAELEAETSQTQAVQEEEDPFGEQEEEVDVDEEEEAVEEEAVTTEEEEEEDDPFQEFFN